MSTPTYIYKIVPSSSPPPFPLPAALPVSELDQKDGFVHLSTAAQVLGTLERFFAHVDSVYLLRIPYASVEKNIKWEDSRGEKPGAVGEKDMFPHLYNGLRLGNEEIQDYQEWKRDSEGWKVALDKAQEEAWFVY